MTEGVYIINRIHKQGTIPRPELIVSTPTDRDITVIL